MHLDSLYQTYKDQADFFFVYIREAHPRTHVLVEENGVCTTMEFDTEDSPDERKRRALLLIATTKLSMPALVSLNETALETDYAPWPTRLLVIDPSGRITFNAGMEFIDSGKSKSLNLDMPRIDQWMREHFLAAAPRRAARHHRAEKGSG